MLGAKSLILWSDLTFDWSDLNFFRNVLTGSDLTIVRSDRNSWRLFFRTVYIILKCPKEMGRCSKEDFVTVFQNHTTFRIFDKKTPNFLGRKVN